MSKKPKDTVPAAPDYLGMIAKTDWATDGKHVTSSCSLSLEDATGMAAAINEVDAANKARAIQGTRGKHFVTAETPPALFEMKFGAKEIVDPRIAHHVPQVTRDQITPRMGEGGHAGAIGYGLDGVAGERGR